MLGLSGALLGLENLAARKVLFDSFGQLEREEGDRSLQQVLKALEADLNQLAISTHDYAAWDDAYEFAKSSRPALPRIQLRHRDALPTSTSMSCG